MTDHTALDALIDSLELRYTATFVPWSQSRSVKADPKLSDYSINWRVRLAKLSPVDGQEFRSAIETDYSQGTGFLPKEIRPKTYGNVSVDQFNATQKAVETGRYRLAGRDRPLTPPVVRDVLHSLMLDSDVINFGSFEDWASNLGYATDSRAAEKIYRACLDIALKLRNMIGEENLAKLREAFQDY